MTSPSTPTAAGKARENVRLGEFTTFRIGGPCVRLFECSSAREVEEAAANLWSAQTPFVLIGSGSNLLVSDEGVPCVILRFVSDYPHFEMRGDLLQAEGGCELDTLVAWTVENGWRGLEFLSGIPGTVGGAVAGNAGAFGRQIGDALVSARVAGPDLCVREIPRSELGFAYRRSRLQRTDEIVLNVNLRLARDDRARLRDERERILARRRERHPDWRKVSTAGSFFKNVEPTCSAGPRQAAGWYLEQIGAKNMRVGRAYVFEKHANIIVAEPGATAREVLELAHQMARAVWEVFQLRLDPEVRLLGSFPQELQFRH